jgi:hypothetical protein
MGAVERRETMMMARKMKMPRLDTRVLRRVWLRTTDIRCPLVGVWALMDECESATDEPPSISLKRRSALLARGRTGSIPVHQAA